MHEVIRLEQFNRDLKIKRLVSRHHEGMTTSGTPHALREQDDSGFTSVVLCACGASFLGFGEDRIETAALQLNRHVEEHRTNDGKKVIDYLNPHAGIITDYERGMTVKEVAQKYRVSSGRLSHLLRSWGVHVRRRTGYVFDDETRAAIIEHRRNGATLDQLALDFGASAATISHRLAEWDAA